MITVLKTLLIARFYLTIPTYEKLNEKEIWSYMYVNKHMHNFSCDKQWGALLSNESTASEVNTHTYMHTHIQIRACYLCYLQRKSLSLYFIYFYKCYFLFLFPLFIIFLFIYFFISFIFLCFFFIFFLSMLVLPPN